MKCDKCGQTPLIIHRKHSGQKLCKDCFVQTIKEKVLKDIRKYKLVEKGDKILLALSGGKDSVMVMEILKNLQDRQIAEITALTVNEGINGYRDEGVRIARENAKKMGINHRVVSFEEYFGITLDEMMKNPQRGACTYCGVFRRWIINKVAREEGATKIATGHNLDDEVQSIIMNYLEGNLDNLTRIGVKSESKYPKFTVKIKPLREIPEKEIVLYVMARELPVHLAGCPYAGDSFRAEVGQFLKEISLKRPTIMYSALRGFDRMKPVLKKEFSRSSQMAVCGECGEPSAGELCKACSFLKDLKNSR
ncbi:MAG: TIGR00269 family protein [Methanobacteriales archaeon Met13]